ncbi:MAG: DNA polymerase III subunit chi [Alphaproteobacteria bacterium]|nr:DNA polymerase III subunit chi [Alphaproteobacteria bacterium]
MADVWFYHLEKQPLEHVLPRIVSMAVERGTPMVIETTTTENVTKLSDLLWAAEDVAFLPHGFEGDGQEEVQAIWLTTGSDTPNDAKMRLLVHGAVPQDISMLSRAMFMFDGNDEQALAAMRAEWKRHKADGHTVSYWRQNENGKWIDQAAK